MCILTLRLKGLKKVIACIEILEQFNKIKVIYLPLDSILVE